MLENERSATIDKVIDWLALGIMLGTMGVLLDLGYHLVRWVHNV